MKICMDERLRIASHNWELTGIESIYVKESGGVYRAHSAEFDSVILKISDDSVALAGEFRALSDMKGNSCCEVYAFDDTYGLLLEERILPGMTLEQEPDWEKRIASFVQVFENIHVVPKSITSYRSYLSWVKSACRSVAEQENKELSEGMCLAVEIAEKMFEKYPARELLHGDLHHENILKNKFGKYVIVDPKGCVGPPIFDIPRFVLNELGDDEDSLRESHIDNVIKTLSYLLKYPTDDCYKLFFMEVMLANAWLFEDGEEIEERDVRFAWEIARKAII